MSNKTNNTIQAFWVGVGSLSSFALSIVSAAILSRYFDKTEYGTYKQIIYIYNTLLVVFTAGLPKIFSYYLPRFGITEGKSVVIKISKALFLSGLIFSIFLFSFSGIIARILNNPELEVGLKFFSPIPALLLPTLGIEGIFSSYKKTIYIAIYNTSTRLLMLIFIVLPVIVFQGTYLYAIYGWLVVSVITFILAIYFKNIPFKGVLSEKAELTFKQVFAYSTPLVAASITGVAIKSADQFYISRYFGPEVFAEYANGFIQLPFVGMVTGAASIVLAPVFSKLVFEKKINSELLSIWQNVILKSATIIYPLVIFFIVFADSLIEILYTKNYSNSTVYFRIAMVTNFFNIIIFAPLLIALGKVKIYSFVHTMAAIFIWGIGYIIVFYTKSPIYVAILSSSTTIGIIIYFIIYSSKQLETEWNLIFPLIKLSLIAFHSVLIIVILKLGLQFITNEFNLFYNLILNGSVFAILLLLTGKFFKIDYISVFRPFLYKIKILRHDDKTLH